MKYQCFLFPILFLCSVSCRPDKQPMKQLSIDFEHVGLGRLSDREMKSIFGNAQLLCGKKDYLFYKLGITPHPHDIDDENGNRYLKVVVPAGFYGPITGAQWRIPIEPADEYYFSYKLKFEKGFDFVKGGKLPGLAGGDGNCGGNVPNGYDGWSARMMFWEGGKLSFYVYFPDQSSKWGERLFLKEQNGDTVRICPGGWHNITQYLKMNTLGKVDGVLKGWFDGRAVFFSDRMVFRKDEKLKVDQVFYSVFMGGGDSSWASAKTEYICFDDFRVSTQPLNN